MLRHRLDAGGRLHDLIQLIARIRRRLCTIGLRQSVSENQERAAMETENLAWLPAAAVGVTVLWTAPNGVRCVVERYDEQRYQLQLLRDGGTIKADLFSDRADAVVASRE